MSAFSTKVFQCRHQPRMITGRVAANDEDQVGVFNVLEKERGRSCSENAIQSDTAGLMTIERTIVDVIRAEDSGEQLQ